MWKPWQRIDKNNIRYPIAYRYKFAFDERPMEKGFVK